MITSAHITNFFSFAECSINFNEPSLILVKGEVDNNDQSNGAGKTSLFEAVYWCLTGKTVRGSKTKNVVRFGQKTCRVAVEITLDDGKVLKVDRVWSASSKKVLLEVNGEKQSFHDAKQGTDEILKHIGVTKELFSLIGWFGAGFTTFAKLSPKEKSDFIDMITGGQMWARCSDNAKTKYNGLKKEVDNCNIQKEVYEKGIASKREELEAINNEVILHKQELGKVIAEIKPMIDAKNQAYTEKKNQVIRMKNDFEALMPIKPTTEDLSAYEEAIETEKGRITLLEGKMNGLTFNMGRANSELIKWEDIQKKGDGDKLCPTCHQPISDPALVQNNIDAQLTILGDLDVEHDKLKAEVHDLTMMLNTKQDAYKIKKAAADRVTDEYAANVSNHQKTHGENLQAGMREEGQLKEELTRLEVQLAEAEQDRKLADLETKATMLTDQIADDGDKIKAIIGTQDKLTDEMNIARFWMKGFKDIRFSLFESVLKFLQLTLVECLDGLDLEFTDVKVAPFRELADGTTAPEVNLVLLRGDQEVPIENLSEGETQKVNLGCFFATSDIVEKWLGVKSPVLVMDEPLNGLDDNSKYKVFQLLKQRFDSKQVFIVDHGANFQELFDATLKVSKNDGVSSIGA